jgi:glycine/D-amino acid oxidase-like deaminating enzyme
VTTRDTRLVTRLSADIVVAGGGAAGVAAATTAARHGHSVILLERYGFCGGGAVAGLSGTVCGLYEATDANRIPEQVVFGFADEFVRRLEARGGLGPALRYGKTLTRVHEPLAWRETADDFLAQAGVHTIYHAVAVGVLREGDTVEGLEVWTKQGPVEIRAGVVIDASGDADVAAMAGLPTFVGDDGRVQNPTMIFRMAGVDVPAFLAAYGDDTIMPQAVIDLIDAAAAEGLALPRRKIWLFPTTRPGEILCNCTRIVGADGRELNTLFMDDFTEAEVEGRRQVREYARFFRERLAGFAGAHVVDTGVQAGVRQTRQIRGTALLSNEDVVSARKHADGIARSPWPIELHSGEKPMVRWVLDDFYEVPYGCLVPERGENIIAAGRCLSAQHEAVASARVTAQCFSYGHAAGIAASLSLRDRVPLRALDGADIRRQLNREGARLG